MTTYDRFTHFIGTLATAILGAQAAGIAPKDFFPVWAIVLAWIVAEVAKATTSPLMTRPTVGEAVKASKIGVLLLAASLAVTGCPHNGPGPSPVSTFGHCTSEALTRASQSLLGHVTTALATGDYVAELAALASQFGADEVGCAVDLVIAELTDMRAHSSDNQVALMLARAQAWRGANP